MNADIEIRAEEQQDGGWSVITKKGDRLHYVANVKTEEEALIISDMIDLLMKFYLFLDDIPLIDRTERHHFLKEETYEIIKKTGVRY